MAERISAARAALEGLQHEIELIVVELELLEGLSAYED